MSSSQSWAQKGKASKQQAARRAAIASNLSHVDISQIDYAFEQFQALEFLVDKLPLTRDQYYDIKQILGGLRPLFSEAPKSDDPC